jgi:anti-anti-sigma factor
MNAVAIPGFGYEVNDMIRLKLELVPTLPECVRVLCVGRIDTYNSNFVLKEFDLVAKSTYHKVWLDLRGVNYMSSTGVGTLSSFNKACRTSGKMLVMSGIQPKILEVLQLLGFVSFCTVADSEENALRLLSEGEASTFPATVTCPICSKRLKATVQGKFKCPQCASHLAIDQNARVSLA